jgi:ABC-2 type transport system permease protein
MTIPLRTLKPIIVKELRQVRRDPTSLGMLMVLPAVLIIMVGYALNFDVKHTPLVVYDQDRSPGSRAFLEKFKHTEYFDYMFEAGSYGEIEDLFLNGRAKIALVLPASFAAGVASGEDEHVQILVDGSDANTAGQAVATASRLTSDYATHVVADAFMRHGRSLPVPVDFQPRVWYNPDLISSKFLVPGLIGFIIVLTAVISTSLTVVREKERGTMEQLMVSPLRPLEIVLGKTIPYLGISLIAASAILILGYILFDVQVAGSLLLLYAAILMIILGGLGQGLLISTVTDSQQVAFMISVFSSLLPSFLLSGFVFPVATMPIVLRILSNLAVNKFFLVVVRGVMLKGVGFGAVWEQFLFMFAFAAFMLLVSAKRMQKRSA